MNEYSQNHLFFVGPLNLNSNTKQADTVTGAELAISETEFDALDILAMREGETLSFDQLYNAVWRTEEGDDCRETARSELEHLIDEVREAGMGFMWIDYVPEKGYTFRTHWGHNWHSNGKTPVMPDRDNVTVMAKSAHTVRFRALVAVAAGAAAVIVIVLMLFKTDTVHIGLPVPHVHTVAGDTVDPNDFISLEENDPVIFDDGEIPLAMPQFTEPIDFPVFDNTFTVGGSEIEMDLYNPEWNNCSLIFEIALAGTREIIYISDMIPPGTRAENPTLTIRLEPGEYKATMYVRAFVPDSSNEIESVMTEVTLIVE